VRKDSIKDDKLFDRCKKIAEMHLPGKL